MSINECLVAIQSGLKAPKGQVNKFGGYKYRSCEDILEAVKPHLKEQKCTLVLTDDIVEVAGRIYVKATATLSNGEESVQGVAFAREAAEKKGMDDSQITGTASSYARKYALNGLFCIDDTKDADTDEYTQQAAKPAAVCSDCKQPISARGKYSVDVIVKNTTQKYGRPLCWECCQNAKKASQLMDQHGRQ